MSDQVFIYTMNQRGRSGRWSRYVFPFTIEHYALLRDSLYLRAGDTVHKVVEGELYDDGSPFDSIIQWQWLDFKNPGIDKTLIGFDIAGEGVCDIQFGYDQTDITKFTVAYTIPADTVPGQIIAFPLTAPSLSVKLTYSSAENWEWSALQLYLMDNRLTS